MPFLVAETVVAEAVSFDCRSDSKLVNVAGIVYGRDDAPLLAHSLKSMADQSHSFTQIFYVDDASEDNSVEVAESYGCTVLRQTVRHGSWSGTPMLSLLPNMAIRQVRDADFFLVNGDDIVLEPQYVEKLLVEMRDRNTVLASGVIDGEAWRMNTPKGAGRMHQTTWWNRFVGEYPFNYCWEAQPIHLAQMHGYRTICIPDAHMTALRPTVTVKENWGRAMRQLGYFPPAVLTRCASSFVRHPRSTVRMFANYLASPSEAVDSQIRCWLRRKQCWRLLDVFRRS